MITERKRLMMMTYYRQRTDFTRTVLKIKKKISERKIESEQKREREQV